MEAKRRFYLNRRHGDVVLDDPDGSELERLEDAVAEALTAARHLWATAIIQQRDLTGDSFEIGDGDALLATVSFELALPPSLRRPEH